MRRAVLLLLSVLLGACDTSFPVPPAPTCSAASCEAGATCSDATGRIVCSCAKGTESPTHDGKGCVDHDECADAPSPCDANATCTNAPGSFSCTCKAGYSGNGASCSDVDECVTLNGGCDAHATCVNTIGSRTCTCQPGYAGSGATCADVDECLVGNGGCAAEALCTNTPGGRSCTCQAGFKGDGLSCKDIDECAVNNGGCDPLSPCINTPGGYSCGNCQQGYTGGGAGKCVDINECTAGTSNCSADAACGNVPGSFTCTCKPGFEGNGLVCANVDACVLYPCNPGFSCADLPPPAPNDATGRSCADVNECLTANGACDANATCTNTPGSRTCACKPGFLGTGLSCADVNECLSANGGCAQSCTNSSGSYACSCSAGFTLNADGKRCDDVNECATANGGCAQTCTNTPGSFACSCSAGFTLNADGKACDDVNECATNNGGCPALCTNLVGSFACSATFAASANLSVTSTASRSCSEGGDMVAYPVLALSSTTATLPSSPASGCLSAGDSVLLINLQGTGASTVNTGSNELLTVKTVSGGTVTFTGSKSRFFGAGATDDANLGTAATNQRVMLQRVPRYGDVTIAAGVTLTANGWNGTSGGVFAFTSLGAVTVSGAIDMGGLGYRGGVGTQIDSATAIFKTQGESMPGQGATGLSTNSANAGGGAGGAKQGGCEGGGGGGGGYSTVGATGGSHLSCSLPGGVGGGVYGAPDLALLFLGSGGGSGGFTTDPLLGRGGSGGGIILLTANQITVNGAITAGGGAGTAEYVDYGGGGGGAGGSVSLRAAQGVSNLASVGVTGGAGGLANGRSEVGGAGAPGRIFPSTTPPVLGGLVAHYNARVASSLVKSGSQVTQWSDLSGGNRHLLVQGGTAPTLGATLLNGRPGLDFGGAGMKAAGVPLANAASVTVFVVMQQRTPGQWGAIVHHGSRDGDWSMEQSGANISSDVTHFQSVNDNSGLDLTLSTGTNYVLTGRITGSTRYFSKTTAAGTTSVSGAGNSIGPANLDFYVGISDANERSNAFIGEIVYYNRALTDAERDGVIGYLQGAWGL